MDLGQEVRYSITDSPKNNSEAKHVSDEVTYLEAIRDRAKRDRNDSYYRKLYQLRLFMAGDREATNAMLSGNYSPYEGNNVDLPEYPDIDPPLGREGIQNHLLVSSRISIQNIVYTEPEFTFEGLPDPLASQINNAWLTSRWRRGDWSSIFYMVGMDVESGGIGFAEIGPGVDGYTSARYIDPLDCLWDMDHKEPAKWDHFFIRTRLTVQEAVKLLGHVYTVEEIESQCVEQTSRVTGTGRAGVDGMSRKVLVTWAYWDGETHCIFIGSIQEGAVLGLQEVGGKLVYMPNIVGVNPYPFIPVATWVDSWAPGVWRPVSKVETSWRLGVMLNNLESQMHDVCKNMRPLNILSTFGLEPRLAKKLEEDSLDWEDVGEILAVDSDNPSSLFHRVPPGEVSNTAMALRALLKGELNAATGVGDAQRGQMREGERTAYEMRQFQSSQGVQAQHLRRRYSSFLSDVARKARAIGSLYEDKTEILQLDRGVIDTAIVPIEQLLAYPLVIGVTESSLTYKSQEDRAYQRIVQLQQVDMPAMQAGVADPEKVFADVYRALGMTDPSVLMREGGPLPQTPAPGQNEPPPLNPGGPG